MNGKPWFHDGHVFVTICGGVLSLLVWNVSKVEINTGILLWLDTDKNDHNKHHKSAFTIRVAFLFLNGLRPIFCEQIKQSSLIMTDSSIFRNVQCRGGWETFIWTIGYQSFQGIIHVYCRWACEECIFREKFEEACLQYFQIVLLGFIWILSSYVC